MVLMKKRIQKTLRFGIEFELFTLDEKGHMANGADQLIARVKKQYPHIDIKRECGKNMIEITTPPETDVPTAMIRAMEDFEAVAVCAAEQKLVLYAYGTYPGAFTPEFHSHKRYRAQQKILGKQRFSIAGRCIGLHIHYSLPWGVFDGIKKIVKPLIRSKNMQAMVDTYNLCIAMDPALFTLAQSSPFYQGKYLAKDSRVIMYRGGKELDSPDGLYANLPQFGALQQYKTTSTDILSLIAERFVEWGEILKSVGRSITMFSKHGSILDNTWNPVKINAHGTMEIRGMDMNHPDVIAAIAVLVKFLLKEIQERHIRVVPSDAAIDTPFSFDGKTIFIPPDSFVRSDLQRRAAYDGFKDDVVWNYCQAFLRMAKQFVPENRQSLLEPLERMVKDRATTSDQIVARMEKSGWTKEKELTPTEAAEVALSLSWDLYNEILTTKERLKKVAA